MTAPAKEALSPEEAAKLPRLYLVPAPAVAEFNDLLRVAERAAEGDSNDDEIDALWRLAWHVSEAFQQSKVVKARL